MPNLSRAAGPALAALPSAATPLATRPAFAQLMASWKDADPDLPDLAEARAGAAAGAGQPRP